MRDLKALASAMMLLVVVFGPGCASTTAEDTELRNAELTEDKAGLQQQVADLQRNEEELGRVLDAKDTELAALRKRSAELNGSNAQLREELAARPKVVARPASVRDERPKINVGSVGDKVEVVNNRDGSVTLRVAGAVMFTPGRAELTKDGKVVLNRISEAIKKQPNALVSVEGHTDATPLKKTKKIWGTNRALSMARALSVEDYLKRERGVSEGRMRIVGWGEHKPIAKGKGKAANARNRRVEIILSRRETE